MKSRSILPFTMQPRGALILAGTIAALLANPAAQAANTIYTTTTTTGNFSAATWTQTGTASGHTVPNTTDAGSFIGLGLAGSITLTLDGPLTIGALNRNSNANGGAFTLNASGANDALTLDGTGATTIAGNGTSGVLVAGEAAIAATSNNSNGQFIVNTRVFMATNLAVGSSTFGSGPNGVVINGNITNSTAGTLQLNLRQQNTGSSLIAGSIGATQTGAGGITIQNLSTNTGGATLSGAIGGAAGIGAAITISNLASGANTLTIGGALGASVTAVTQNSGASRMILTGGNSAFTGPTTISAGALQANDNAGLSGASFLSLDGGVLQANSATNFNRSFGVSGGAFQFTANGGGFAATGGQLTVNIGGAAAELVWGSTVGSQLVGPLKFGSTTASARTLWQNGINLSGADRTLNATAGTGTESNEIAGVIRTSTGTAGLVKTGTGVVTLSAANTYNGTTTISGGALQATDGVGLPTGSYLSLDGSVLQSNGVAAFTRGLGTSGASTFQFTANGGGFSANGGQHTVNIGGALAELVWGSTVGTNLVGTLQFGSASANNRTLFQNGIDLAAATRTINVTNGAGGDVNEIIGVLRTSSGTAGLTKTGTGNLLLTGANTYNGATTVSGGTLSTNLLAVEGAGGGVASGLGTSGNAATSLLLANGTTLRYTGASAATDRLFTINGTAAANGATLDASGTGEVAFSNTGNLAYGTNNQTRTLTLTGSNAGNNTLAAALTNNGSGAVSVAKTGAGVWVLSGANSYTGTTSITSQGAATVGSLRLASATAWGTGAGTLQLGGNTNNTNDQGNVVFATGAALTGTPNVTLVHGNTNTYTDTITFDAPAAATPGYTQNLGTLTASQKTRLAVTQTANLAGQAVAAFGNFTMSGSGNNAGGGNTFIPTGGAAMTFSNLINSTAGFTTTLTLDGTTTGNAITGVIANNATTGLTAITKQSTSTWTLRGANTYTGATAINGGTLALGATGTAGATLAATPVTVGSGGIFAVTPGVATTTNNSLNSSLTLNGGSAFTMVDGFTNTFNVTGNANLFVTGTAPTLAFDIGANDINDRLAIGGAASLSFNGAKISVQGIGTLVTGDTHTLITGGGASTLDTNGPTLATNRVVVGNTAYNLSLANTATTSVLTVGTSGQAFAYWKGTQGSVWTTPATTPTNWATDSTGATDANGTPTSFTDVFFTAAGAGNLTNTLGADTTINSLNFTATASPVIIGAGNTLTTLGGSFGNIGVSNASAVTQTILAPILLGTAQTWTSTGAGVLTVAGTVDNGGFLLTTAGTGPKTITGVISGLGGLTATGGGVLTLSGINDYSGLTTVNSGATIVLGDAAALGSNFGNTTIASGGTLDLAGQTIGENFGTIAGTGVGGNGALVNSGAAASINGTINGGTSAFTVGGAGDITLARVTGSTGVGITKTGAGTLTLGGFQDNASLALTVNAGTVVLGKGSSGGTHATGGPGVVVNGGTLQLGGTGGDQIFDAGATSFVTVNGGTFDLNARNETIAGLVAAAPGGNVTNTATGTSTLTIGSSVNVSSSYAGAITDGGLGKVLALIKAGTGVLTLTGTSNYSGGTMINAGTLRISNNAALGDTTSSVTIGNNTILQAGGIVTGTRAIVLAGFGRIDANGQVISVGSVTGPGGDTLEKIGAGTLNLNGNQTYDTLTTTAGITNVNGSFTSGTATVNANAATTFTASQTLDALNIGPGAVVTFGAGPEALPFAAGASVAVVPEPGTALSLIGSLSLLLGLSRRQRVG